MDTPPRTPRRQVVFAFGLALFAATAIGLSAVGLRAEANGGGGKAGWAWAVPFAGLLVLPPTLAFAASLAAFARDGLAWPRTQVTAAATLLGGLVPSVLFVVKPVVGSLGLGGSFFGGLAVAQIGLCTLAVAGAAALAAMRPPR